MIKVVTQILWFFQGLFTRMGVDFDRMLAIVTVKLTVDNRIDRSGRGKKNTSNALMRQGILLGICGLIFFLTGIASGAFGVSLLLFQSYLFLMLMMSFMMEYSRILFDGNDNHILRHLPVNSKTILVARLVSMLVYMFFLSGCMSVIPLVIVCFWKGVMSGAFFIISVFLNTIFTLLFANVIYLVVMRFISVEKFQRVMSYVQVVLIAGVALSYQLVGQLIYNIQLDMFQPGTWMYFTPPCYFMSLTVMVKQPTGPALLLALIGVGLVVGLGYITVAYLAPYFAAKVGVLNSYSPVSKKHKGGKEGWLYGLARVFGRSPMQVTGFVLGWRMTRDNLKFRQGVLPMMIYTMFLAVFFLYQGRQEETGGIAYYMPLYMMAMISIGIQMNMSITDKGDLLWLYRSKPLERPGALILGCFKALFVKYYLPVYVLLCGIFVAMLDWVILPDLLFILVVSTLVSYIYLWFSGMLFPFSKEKSSMDSGRNMLRVIVLMLMLVLVGGAHTLAMRLSWFGIWGAIVVMSFLVFLMEFVICRVSWRKVISNY